MSDHKSAQSTIEDKLNDIFWKLSCYPGTAGIDQVQAKKAIQAIITTETTRAAREAVQMELYMLDNIMDGSLVAPAITKYLHLRQEKLNDMLATDSTPASGESDAPSNALQKEQK